MYDLVFFLIVTPIGLLAAAVGRTVMLGPKPREEKATSKWLLNILLFVLLLCLLGGMALLRQSVKGAPTVFDVMEGAPLPPAY